MSDRIHLISRRSLLAGTAGTLASLGLGFESEALAGPPNKIMGKDLAAIEAKHPAGSLTPPEAKLDANTNKLATALLHKSRHAFALAATNPTAKFPAGTIHATAAGAFAHMSPKRVQRAKSRAGAMLASPTKTAVFGPYADGQLASATAKSAKDLQLSPVVRDLTLSLKDAQKKKENDKNKEDAGPKFTRIAYELNSLKCIEKQDSSAHDEILISGNLVDRDGNVTKIDRIKYQGFSSGECKYLDYEAGASGLFAPICQAAGHVDNICPHGSVDDVYHGRKLIDSKLSGPGVWVVMLVLGEQDDGGFTGWMSDLYKQLKAEVDKLVEEVLQAVGETIGAALSTYLGPLGEALGVAIGWALGKLYEWLTSLIGDPEDDILGAFSWTTQFDQRTQAYVKTMSSDPLPSPKGTWATSMKKFTYKSQGGHYEMRWHWRAFEA